MAKDDDTDSRRRAFLKHTTVVLGLVGAAGISSSFLSYLKPNAKVKEQGLPVKLDVSTIKVGEQKTVIWRGKPVWVIRRSLESVKTLKDLRSILKDPDSLVDRQPKYARNAERSIRPDFLVLLGVCSHLGCAPTYRPDPKSVDSTWPGGFYCSCHGSKFDMAGRVFKNMPAPTNLEVPPYYFRDRNTLIIGEEGLSVVETENFLEEEEVF